MQVENDRLQIFQFCRYLSRSQNICVMVYHSKKGTLYLSRCLYAVDEVTLCKLKRTDCENFDFVIIYQEARLFIKVLD